jgi:hypothetical protein
MAGTAGSRCEDVSTTGGKCTPATTTTQGSAQLCVTNTECKTGQCIWQDCMVGILAPSLTMCGIQGAAPFKVSHEDRADEGRGGDGDGGGGTGGRLRIGVGGKALGRRRDIG